MISKYSFNDRFPFSRVFQETGYFDMFQGSTTYEYYDGQAQPVGDWKANGFRPQFSITQTLLKNEADEQIKKVEIRFFGGIAFLYSRPKSSAVSTGWTPRWNAPGATASRSRSGANGMRMARPRSIPSPKTERTGRAFPHPNKT